jgi:hypothetical protein
MLLFGAAVMRGQTCPGHSEHGLDNAQRPSVLHGILLVHNEIRKWIGLKLDQPACGQTEVQLVFSKAGAWREAEALRGCVVTATGKLYDSPTGYYSAGIAISNAALKPDPSCRPSPVREDPNAAPIPPSVKAYFAAITVDYRGKGHADVKVWQDDEKSVQLAPWQAYVSYNLTGGLDVIWFDCQKDFRINDITQSPQNPNGILQDEPNLTGTVLQDISGTNVIKFSCQKKPETASPKDKPSEAKPK